MNAAALAALRNFDLINYVGPVNPPTIMHQKIFSKALRVSGNAGSFFQYSQQRLKTIAAEVRARCLDDAGLDFFHGFTPWILTEPRRPYVAWSDCTFRDYIDIYHRRADFDPNDLARIERAEADWLKGADRVLFTSEWALGRAAHHYGIDRLKLGCVGIFGEVDMPDRDVYAGGQTFVFVSTNFEAKGGPVVLSAFRKLRERHATASLIIIGDGPPRPVTEQGVVFAGFLRKEVPEEYKRLQDALATARAVVHPTRSDISPLLLVECGYFGCPAISSRKFAIPELVENFTTGLLLDDPSSSSEVANAMDWVLADEARYQRLRHAAWSNARTHHSKRRFEERLTGFVATVADHRETDSSTYRERSSEHCEPDAPGATLTDTLPEL